MFLWPTFSDVNCTFQTSRHLILIVTNAPRISLCDYCFNANIRYLYLYNSVDTLMGAPVGKRSSESDPILYCNTDTIHPLKTEGIWGFLDLFLHEYLKLSSIFSFVGKIINYVFLVLYILKFYDRLILCFYSSRFTNFLIIKFVCYN